MNVRMMPPQGPMGQPMPQGGAPAPMGPPMGGPPPMPMGGPMPQQSSGKGQGLGATFGGSAAGRGQFKQFMSSKKQQAPSMQVPQMPMASAMPQSPMLPPPMPTNMGAMKPMGAPNMGGGAPQLGRQAPVGGGIGSAPMGVASNTNAVRGFADGGSVPRQTEIAGQPHYLAYINPEEGDILKGLGGSGIPGPGGVPSYITWDDVVSFFSGDSSPPPAASPSNDRDERSSIPVYDNYYDAIDAEGVGATVNIGGNIVSAETADGYTGVGSTASDSYVDDTFGSGNVFTETTPGASTVNFGNDDDNDYSYTDTSSISGISDASGTDYTNYDPTAGDDDVDTSDVDDVFGSGNIFTEDTDGASTVDFGIGDNAGTTDTGMENEAYGGSQEEFYNAGGFGGSDDVGDGVGAGPGADPVYFDMFGGQHSTLDAANEADKNYLDSEQSGIDLMSQSDGQAGYTFGGMDFEGPDFMGQDIDTGPSQYEIDASNNTAKLMNDYSAISDDYSTFQGLDLTKEDANTIGYATGGSKAGYSAVINPSTGGIDILTPGSKSVAGTFEANELEDALNFLTDGDIDLTNLDAPLDLLPEASGGTGQVTLDSAGNIVEYGTGVEEGIDSIQETIDKLNTEGISGFEDVGATDDDLATDFSTVSTGLPDASTEFDEFITADGVVTRDEIEADLADDGLTDYERAAFGTDAETFYGDLGDTEIELDVADGSEDVAGSFENIFNTQPASDISNAVIFENLTGDKFLDLSASDQAMINGGNFTVIEMSDGRVEVVDTNNPTQLEYTLDKNNISDYKVLGTGDVGSSDYVTSDNLEDDVVVDVPKTREQKIDDLVAAGVDRTLAEASIDSLEGGVNVDDGTSAAELRDTLVEQVMSTQPTASELYLSAMGKVGSGVSDFSPEEQRALYGARGQVPNAAETAYLQSLLRDVKHTSDSTVLDEREYITSDGDVIANPNYMKPMYKAGDSVVKQTLGETVEDFFVKAFDIFVNPLTIFGDDYTLEGANARNVQAQLDAYKNGGTFVYGEDGATVVGVAQPNFDASGDGNKDTVVLINDDGEITVSSGAVAKVDIENSNKNSGLDSDVDDIDLIDSGTTFTNTEDGVVQESAFDDIVVGGDDSGADPCPEGFYLDPVTGICMPMDDIGEGGDASGGGISIGGINRGGSGFDYITGGVPSDAKGLKIKTPKQFNRGGMVSPNIDRFIQSLAS